MSQIIPRVRENVVEIFDGTALRGKITITNKIIQIILTGDEITILDNKGKTSVYKWRCGSLVRRF